MRIVSIAAILIGLAAPARAQSPARKLTLSEAVALAQRDSDAVRIAAESVRAAEKHMAVTSAQRFPKLQTEANVIYWDKELAFTLPDPMTGMPITNVFRERLTSTARLQLIQPITPVLVLEWALDMDRAAIKVARAEQDQSRHQAGYQVAEAYLRLLQASAMRGVAAAAVDQLEAHLARAGTLKQAGLAQDADLLRLEAARDGARQALLQAESGIYTGQHALALALGLPPEERIEVIDDLPATPPPPPVDEEEAARRALAMRPEGKVARARAEQAAHGRRVATGHYYPIVTAIGQVEHNEGTSTFSPKNSWFVGVNLTWDLWDWGKTRSEVAEAAARRRQAEIAAEATADQVAFEARRRAREAAIAAQSLAAAQSAVRAAEEAYRIRGVALGQGEATTTDVLDAETEVARARSQAVVARYDYYLALTALARAIGGTPVPIP